jgi:hypothetical protein
MERKHKLFSQHRKGNRAARARGDNLHRGDGTLRDQMQSQALAEINRDLIGMITGRTMDNLTDDPLPFPNIFFQHAARVTHDPAGNMFPMFEILAELVRDPRKGTKKEREMVVESLQRVLANDAAGVGVGESGQPVVNDVGSILPPVLPRRR